MLGENMEIKNGAILERNNNSEEYKFATFLSSKQLNNKEEIQVIECQINRLNDKIIELTRELRTMHNIITAGNKSIRENKKNEGLPNNKNLNIDGLPIGMECWGYSEKSMFLVFMKVEEKSYKIGNKEYNSLSAAAEAVSGIRRSGWIFWKVGVNGKNLKELFKSHWDDKTEE